MDHAMRATPVTSIKNRATKLTAIISGEVCNEMATKAMPCAVSTNQNQGTDGLRRRLPCIDGLSANAIDKGLRNALFSWPGQETPGILTWHTATAKAVITKKENSGRVSTPPNFAWPRPKKTLYPC